MTMTAGDAPYVTACALGLAFSHRPHLDAVEELIRAAEGRVATLKAARAALPGHALEDPSQVRAAARLLTAAAAAVRERSTVLR